MEPEIMPFLKSLPQNATLPDVFNAFPDAAIPLLDYQERVLRNPSPFTAGERELIAAYVSALNDCDYCQGLHEAVAARLGFGPAVLAVLLEDVDTAPVGTEIKPVFRYARKLTFSPGRVSAEDAAAMYEVGWDDKALHDVVSIVALINFMNRFVAGLGITANENYFEKVSAELAIYGYTGLAKRLIADKECC